MTDLGKWLKETLKLRKLSQDDLVDISGVSKGTISGIITRRHIPKAETLQGIADALGEPVEKLYRLAGYLSERPGKDPLEEEMIAVLRQLSERHKRMLLVQMRALAQTEISSLD